MSSIDPSAAQTALFEKLGISKNTDAQKASSDSLGQSDFLKLMTTQLQNQDPFAPMDNGDFIAQMAQFSTVTGIEEVNSSLKTLVNKFDQGRIATASNLLGHSVLVPGNISRPDDKGELHGVLDLPQATSMARVVISDADSGEELNIMDLGPQAAGLVGFSWKNIPEEIQIVGFTNGILSRYSTPPLTSVNRFAHTSGEIAARRLIDKIEEKIPFEDNTTEIIKTKLVERNSTKKMFIKF